ncbi:MAG TPA: DNA methyltransferase [Acetobacteraceae bacterium]|nr:DNA methyltransferase [Acetobacteraceae bacterium]
MTPAEFIAKWQASTRNERAACQEHFIDLCRLLDEPTPNSDPTGEDYAFEKGATRFTGQAGWADVWRRHRFAWEYKKQRGDLDAAYRQLLLYAGPLGNPPLLVVSDIARIVIRTNFTNAITETHEIALAELANPLRLRLLKWVFSDPEELRPRRTRQALTEEAAAEFAELARRLRVRGHDPQVVAHFVNRLVFCMFADDVGLLREGLFDQMLDLARRRPARSAEFASQLFDAMAKSGGVVGFTAVPWFDGGLFDDATALPLERDDIDLLIRVAKLDWAEIDPSILGTLFERGLDPDKRSQLGAHYTNREKIEMLIDPVIRRPLQAEWKAVRERIEAALAMPANGRRGRNGRDAAQALYHGFLQRLREFRVLDPACGSGNFLYLSLQALKDLEHQASVEAEALGLQRAFPQVGPETMLGIEINPYAAELARVSVWIGHIQWTRRHGYAAPSDPVLQPLETIECRDAVLTKEGRPAAWPNSDVIVGNPPFLGAS